MSWVYLDDNFPNHPKTVKAGPSAAYLFVCGLCYCRKYHTGGFIPAGAVKTLGVIANPRKMIDALAAAGLWTIADGGFQVHGYVEQYDDGEAKAKKEERAQQKRDAGRLGGQKRVANLKQKASTASSTTQAPASSETQALGTGYGSGLVPVVVLQKEERREPEVPKDAWIRELQASYPRNRVTYGFMTESAFVSCFQEDPRPAPEVWAEMQANLANQTRGHEWRVKGLVPRLEKWLREGLWRQQHEEFPVSERVSNKTSRTITAAAAIMREGQS